MPLYKYRSLNNFRNFVDIILKSRLYAARYLDMNDPMEGHYFYKTGQLARNTIRSIKDNKLRLEICSLSRTPNDPLMWAHYADGHRGVVIGVEVDRNNYDIREVVYSGPSHIQNPHINDDLETAKRILCHKHEAWFYEEEERIFVTDGRKFVNVTVREVILGSRMSSQDKEFIQKLIPKLNPDVNVSSSDIDQIV
jgi:hypothetical protein